MKNSILLCLVSVVVFINACGQSNTSNILKKEQSKSYHEQKSKFDSLFISQFPNELELDSLSTAPSNEDVEKNDVGLYLYEYGISESKIDAIVVNLNKETFIAKYSSNDTCLFVINPFQVRVDFDKMSKEELKNYKEPELPNDYKKEVLRKCKDSKYPVPNFVDYINPIKRVGIKLDSDFDIYVIEAKAGLFFKKYDLIPDKQMPKKWENGYSRGIAINKEKRTVIYWSAIW